MKHLIFFMAFFLGADAIAQVSYVPPTKALRKKGYQIQLSGEYFSTSKYADINGDTSSLPDGQKFDRFQGEFSGQYGATDQLQFGLGGRYRMNQATLLNLAGEEERETSSGLESIFSEIKYAFLPVGRLHYALEGQFRYTPYTNKIQETGSNTEMILGDDGNEYSAGMGVTYAFPSNDFITVRGGYRDPGQELSPEIYWQAEGALVWKYVALVAGVNGVSSLNSDPQGDELVGQTGFNTGTTGLYNSINREWIAPYAGLNIALGKSWRLELRGSQTVSGRSTDLGTTIGFALSRRVETITNTLDSRFKDYDFEASVTKVSPKKQYLVIDKGLADDVQKGMVIDFYEYDYVGGNILVARGTVIQSKADTAVVKITQRYNTKKELKEGLVGRGTLRH